MRILCYNVGMRLLKPAFFFWALAAALVASAEVTVIDGKRYECKDGLCMLVEDGGEAASSPLQDKDGSSLTSAEDGASPLQRGPRIAQGYMTADEFIAFLENREAKSPFAETGVWLTLLLVLLGGLAMNLTPCVLPMIPINLMIIGRSAKRGAAYGLGMAIAYGALGVAAAFGGLAFGDIQGSPWFNAAVAAIFVALALALLDVWMVDLSRLRSGVTISDKRRGRRFPFVGFPPWVAPFGMGALSAVLAGACVAPILISVLLLTGKLYAEGKVLAVGLPFVLGLGMALPWPFLGAGLKVLPKPGAWMKGVSCVFAVAVLGFAAWYGWLAWQGFQKGEAASSPLQEKDGGVLTSGGDAASPLNITPSALYLRLTTTPEEKPILVDCWATWCKNCAAMDRVMEDERVKKALAPFDVIRVQAEDISELRKVKGFESIRGLPAFVVFD